MKLIFTECLPSSHKVKISPDFPDNLLLVIKPDTVLLRNNENFYCPKFVDKIACKQQLAIKINRIGKHIERKFANRYFHEVALGLEFIATDLLKNIQQQGLPWDMVNSFDRSTAISSFLSTHNLKNIHPLRLKLFKNEQCLEEKNIENFQYSIEEIIAFVSCHFTLKIGDLIFISDGMKNFDIKIGDQLKCLIANQQMLNFSVK